MLTISYYLILFAIQYCNIAYLAVRILRCKLEEGLDQPIIFHEVASSSHPMISCPFLCKVALFPPNKGYLLRRQWEVPSSPLNNIRCLTHWWRNNPASSESPQDLNLCQRQCQCSQFPHQLIFAKIGDGLLFSNRRIFFRRECKV